MDFRIRHIILWSKSREKEPRLIQFELDKINVITGESHKGKSSLVHIVDYCLGSKRCTIPVGRIRESTEWFGIHVVLNGSEMILARKEPGQQISTNEMFLQEGKGLDIPQRPFKNINSGNVVNRLNQIAGFSTLDFEEEETSGALSDRASFRDTSAFQFQPQHIVANPHTLFFKADTFQHQEKLKTIFPLVLGAVTKEVLAWKRELNELERLLARKQSMFDQKKSAKNIWLANVKSLYNKALALGLVRSEDINTDDWDVDMYLINLNRVVMQFNNGEIQQYKAGTSEASVEAINNLREKSRDLSSEIASRKLRLGKIEQINKTKTTYTQTIQLKQKRLEPIGWLSKKLHKEDCPFCGSKQDAAKKELESLKTVLTELEEVSQQVSSQDLVLDKEIEEIKKTIRELEEERNQVQSSLGALVSQNEEERNRQNLTESRYRFLGGLEQSLKNMEEVEDDSSLPREIGSLKEQVSLIKGRIRENDERSLRKKALDRFSNWVSHYVEHLDIDKPKDTVQLDITNLTLRITSEDNRDNFLWEVGSGANWMGYHIAALLALHELFLELKQNYVPSFLFIDQPTQVYFPEKWPNYNDTAEPELDASSDFAKARKIFQTLDQAMQRTKNKLQIIVVEHAPEITWRGIDSVFLVEEWRGENALIPKDW